MEEDSVPVVELDHEVEEVGLPKVGGGLLGVLGPSDPAPTKVPFIYHEQSNMQKT